MESYDQAYHLDRLNPGEPPPNAAARPRKSARVGLAAEVVFRRSGRMNYQVKVFDVSLHGCKAEIIERPDVGERVWIKFEDLQSLEATVCWVKGFETGLEFQSPIHPAIFDLLVSRLKAPLPERDKAAGRGCARNHSGDRGGARP